MAGKGYYRPHSVLGMVDCKDNATEEEVKRGLLVYEGEHKGFWWQRFYDVKDYMRSCPSCHAPINQCPVCHHDLPPGGLPPKRPSDFWALYNGTFYLLECKSSTSKQGWLHTLIKPHQIESLTRNYQCGGKSMLLIANRADKQNPRLLTMSIGDYCGVMGSRSFVKWEALEGVASIVERIPCHGEPYFPLDSLFPR